VAVVVRNIWGARPRAMASAVARTCNGGLGAEPPAIEVQGQSPWSGKGRSPLKLKHFWLLDVQWKSQICFFVKLKNAKKPDICVIIARNHAWLRNWGGGWNKTGSLCPRPGPKTATERISYIVMGRLAL